MSGVRLDGDAEVFTRGSSSREFLLSENLGGMTHDWFASTSSYNVSLKDKVDGFTFKAFPPPASITGVRMEERRPVNSQLYAEGAQIQRGYSRTTNTSGNGPTRWRWKALRCTTKATT